VVEVLMTAIPALFAYLIAVDKRTTRKLRTENKRLTDRMAEMEERDAAREKEHREALQQIACLKGTLQAMQDAEAKRRRPRT